MKNLFFIVLLSLLIISCKDSPTAPYESRVDTVYVVDTSHVEYKEYVALITQSGYDDPTAIIISNTLGFVPTWRRKAEGTYEIHSPGLFSINKTVAIISGGNGLSTSFHWGYFFQPSTLELYTVIVGTSMADSQLFNTPVIIRVYN